jgi:hypothetical protein
VALGPGRHGQRAGDGDRQTVGAGRPDDAGPDVQAQVADDEVAQRRLRQPDPGQAIAPLQRGRGGQADQPAIAQAAADADLLAEAQRHRIAHLLAGAQRAQDDRPRHQPQRAGHGPPPPSRDVGVLDPDEQRAAGGRREALDREARLLGHRDLGLGAVGGQGHGHRAEGEGDPRGHRPPRSRPRSYSLAGGTWR